jgi:hypothetical protein
MNRNLQSFVISAGTMHLECNDPSGACVVSITVLCLPKNPRRAVSFSVSEGDAPDLAECWSFPDPEADILAAVRGVWARRVCGLEW